MALTHQEPSKAVIPPYDFGKFAFVWSVHLLTLLGAICWGIGYFTVTMKSILLALAYFVAGSTVITAGYHRLYAHATYTAHWLLELLYVLVGPSAFQGSILQWSAQHRDHHTFVDKPKDPYNIRLGFWFAHMGWVVRKTNPNYERVSDLQKNPLLRFQFNWYYPLAFLTTFIVPLFIGNMWHEAIGTLFMVGFVRLLIQWHMTFCVNSVAHYYGSQKYSIKHSARGSWWLSFVTWGEMDHNYHHSFPNDFRTGTRWYDFDPGKWWIWLCSRVGLASELRMAEEKHVVRALARTIQATTKKRKHVQ